MCKEARIYWSDEMGLQSCDNRDRTYGLERGRFKLGKNADDPYSISHQQLAWLLDLI